MSEAQQLIEVQKIKKLLTPGIEKVKKVRGRAKRVKLKDLLKGENLKERLNNFIDKLTLDDLLKAGAFIALVMLIYPFVYALKPKAFWEKVMYNARFLQWIGYIGITPWKDEETEFDFGCFLVSIIVAYLFIYQGGTIRDIASGIIAVL